MFNNMIKEKTLYAIFVTLFLALFVSVSASSPSAHPCLELKGSDDIIFCREEGDSFSAPVFDYCASKDNFAKCVRSVVDVPINEVIAATSRFAAFKAKFPGLPEFVKNIGNAALDKAKAVVSYTTREYDLLFNGDFEPGCYEIETPVPKVEVRQRIQSEKVETIYSPEFKCCSRNTYSWRSDCQSPKTVGRTTLLTPGKGVSTSVSGWPKVADPNIIMAFGKSMVIVGVCLHSGVRAYCPRHLDYFSLHKSTGLIQCDEIDSSNDLVTLTCKHNKTKNVISDLLAPRGSTVTISLYRLSEGVQCTVVKALQSGTYGLNCGITLLPGDSGSPVYYRSEVIGIVSGKSFLGTIIVMQVTPDSATRKVP